MNNLEKKLIDILIDLRENYQAIGIKAEFEDEGTRTEEAFKLKEIISHAGLDLTIKIGGCGALKDMCEAKNIGAANIVAPMIESTFALEKFIKTSQNIFSEEERKDLSLFINIETITAHKNLEAILNTASERGLDGIVIGRGDLAESMGMKRENTNSSEIFDITKDILVQSKAMGFINGIGGGISLESLPFFQALPEGKVDFYETRKVIFSGESINGINAKKGILKALEFELLWLKNKQDFSGSLYKEDFDRINVLESYYQKSLSPK